MCPRATTSLTGSSVLENCTINAVDVCNKVPSNPRDPLQTLTYYPKFTYNPLDNNSTSISFNSDILLSKPSGEVVTVAIINPVNVSSSDPLWVNETTEVFRTCPSYGPADGVGTVVVIGRNFINTSLNFCKWRACLSSDLGVHPFSCRNTVDAGLGVALPVAGILSSVFQVTEARFISNTRMECNIPPLLMMGRDELQEFQSSDDFFSLARYRCLWVSMAGLAVANESLGSISYVRECDTLVSCLNKPFHSYEYFTTLYFPCSTAQNSLNLCSNSPENGYMFNPCISGEVAVEVTNDGILYSGGLDSFSGSNMTIDGVSILSTVREIEPGIVYMNFKNATWIPTFAVFTYVATDQFPSDPDIAESLRLSCLSPLYIEEAPRPSEQGWFNLEYHEKAEISIDLTQVPDFMVYGQHYRLALFMQPSRCTDTLCNTAGQRVPDEEFLPCHLPADFGQWFDDPSVPKNLLTNISVYALEDIIFKLEVQILYGIFLPFAPFFENTSTVRIEAPQRARVLEGLSSAPLRPISPYTSAQQRLTTMKYIFVAIVSQSDSNSISQPYNLPPTYSNYAQGRALVSYNASANTGVVPDVIDSVIVNGIAFWSLPAPTSDETKELIDAYFETFYQMTYDASTGYQFAFSTMIIPYLPYFSNCFQYDSYIPFWQLFESKECKLPQNYPEGWARYKYPSLPNQDDIQYVSSWDVGAEPIADWCIRSLACNYEESLANPDSTPRWFEASTGSTLFQLLRDPVEYDQFTSRSSVYPSSGSEGGGQAVIDAALQSEDNIIMVTIDHSFGDIIVGCSILCYARTYLLDITYFQVNNHNKRIVSATLIGNDYDFNSSDTSYTLNAQLRPLSYVDLLLNFQFDISLYFVLSCAVGLLTIVLTMITWAVARLTTMLQNPPDIKIVPMLSLIAPPALAGGILAIVPIWFLTSFGNLLINGYFASNPL